MMELMRALDKVIIFGFGEQFFLCANGFSQTTRIEQQHRPTIVWQCCSCIKPCRHHERRTGFDNKLFIINDRCHVECKSSADRRADDD